MDQRLRRRFRILLDIPRFYFRSLSTYRWNLPAVTRRYAASLKHRYLPGEAFEIGLLNPATPPDAVKRTVSKSEVAVLQRWLNPADWEWVLADKGIFYRTARAAGLPVPELYGLFFRDAVGWTSCGKAPARREEWQGYFEGECPREFVLKPARGVYGSGVKVVVRSGDRFLPGGGTSLDAGGLAAMLYDDPDYSAFVIQERLHNHESVAGLGSGEGVHSFRLVTLVEPGQGPRVVWADMKLIVGGNVTSNLAHGRSGNLIAEIGVDDGRLRTALLMDVERGGYREVVEHPDSRVVLAGFPVPEWETMVALAVRAAAVYLPVRTVGWDIALARGGPCLLEGNVTYDPSLQGMAPDFWAVSYRGGGGMGSTCSS